MTKADPSDEAKIEWAKAAAMTFPGDVVCISGVYCLVSFASLGLLLEEELFNRWTQMLSLESVGDG